MRETPPKEANTPEHIEVVRSEIRDGYDKIEFVFDFAKRITKSQATGYWYAPEHTLPTIMWGKLKEKGWASEETTPEEAEMLYPTTTPSNRGKTWTYTFY